MAPVVPEDIIRDYYAGKEGIAAVFLFGSRAKGQARVNSDFDVAVLYENNQPPDLCEHLSMREDLVALLKSEVDLVNLNTANPILRRQVLKSDHPLLIRNRRAFADFFTRAQFDYDDLVRVRRPIEAKIARGRVYG